MRFEIHRAGARSPATLIAELLAWDYARAAFDSNPDAWVIVPSGTAEELAPHCLVTGADGGLPSAESWQVGLYDGQDDSQTCLWNAVHWTDGPEDCREVSPLSLFEAVNACLSIIAEREGH
jgi:hypothetical protein